jgi:hypothetical protein
VSISISLEKRAFCGDCISTANPIYIYPIILYYPMPDKKAGSMAPKYTIAQMIAVHNKLKAYILTKTLSTSSDPTTNNGDTVTEFVINGMTLKLRLKTSPLSVDKGPPFESVLSFYNFSNIHKFDMFPRGEGAKTFGSSYHLPLFVESYDEHYLILGILDGTPNDEYRFLISIIDVMAVELPLIINVFNPINTWNHSIRVKFDGYNRGKNRSFYEADVDSDQTSGFLVYPGKQKFTFVARDDVSQILIKCNALTGFAPKTVPFCDIEKIVTAYMKLPPPPPVTVPLAICYRELEQRIDKLLIRML